MLTVAPTLEPVSLQEVRNQARVLDQDFDELLESSIPKARKAAEQYLGRALIEQQYNGYLSRFYPEILIPNPPLMAVSQIEYVDRDGNAQIVDPSAYNVDTISDPGIVSLAYGESWPDTMLYDRNAVKISYTAGYGANPWDVPLTIRHAIKILCVTFFDNPSLTGQSSSGSNDMIEGLYRSLLGMNRNFLS